VGYQNKTEEIRNYLQSVVDLTLAL